MEHKMFCYQCQETAGCSGCTQMGVCGKKPEVAAMQDLLIYVSKGLSAVTTQLRKEGTKVSEETNHLITWNLFTTITNANFDNEAIIARIHNTLSVRRTLILQVKDTSGLPEAAFWDIKQKMALTHRMMCSLPRQKRQGFSPQKTRTSAVCVN